MARLCLCQHQLSKHTRVGGRAREDAHVHPVTSPPGAPELTVQVESVVGCTSGFQCAVQGWVNFLTGGATVGSEM